MAKNKLFRFVVIFVILLAVVSALFLFLREVFSGRLIVRDYIFQIGNFRLRWYSVCIATGIFTGYFLARRRLKNYPITPEDLDEGLFWGLYLESSEQGYTMLLLTGRITRDILLRYGRFGMVVLRYMELFLLH